MLDGTENARAIIAILALPGVGRRLAAAALDRLRDTPSSPTQLIDLCAPHVRKLPTRAEAETAWNKAREILDRSAEGGVRTLSILDEEFPSWVRDIPDAPVILFVKGNREPLFDQRAVAVIGTREPSDYGMACGIRIAVAFATAGITVVSGLAKGCDTAGHEGCLRESGKTIAVMAGGLDRIYPAENNGLAADIIDKGGCLVSEYPVGQKPFKTNFVERDRLQSAFSRAVFVVETGITGGTLHTVGFAQKQKRLLACLQHPEKYAGHPKAAGNLDLIRRRVARGIVGGPDLERFIEEITKEAPSAKPTEGIEISTQSAFNF